MKTLIISLFFVLISLGAMALEKGIITGKVVEQVGALSIPSAVVAIYLPGSEQPLLTTPTDENGIFKFSNLKPGSYTLKVSYIGFTTLTVNQVVITTEIPEKNLGTLKLSSDQNNLGEVTISADKPVIQFSSDMITYNVEKSILAEGSTASDVLKNVPMVEIDMDGKASISGKRSTRIFIDGKPSDYMTSNIGDLLNVLPSDAIEKIEVMTNPPAKYSGDGEGIINIVMKKGFKIGFGGNAGITAGLQGNTNTNTNASYKSKNYSVNGGAAYNYTIGKNENHNYRENFFTDTTYYHDNYGNSENLGNGGNVRLAFDWDISKAQNLRLSTNFNTNSSTSNSGTDYHYLDEDLIENIDGDLDKRRLRNQSNTSDGNNHNFVFDVDYSIKTDTTGGKLSLGITYNDNQDERQRLLNRDYFLPETFRSSLQENNNEISNNGLNLNADYDKPVFKKRDQIELGIKFNYRKNNNDQLSQNFDYITQQYVINDNLSNEFLYYENIFAGYAAYNLRGKEWSAKAGLRAELTAVNFDLSAEDMYHIDPYLSLFPNFSVNRQFNKKYTVGAAYSVRVNRPRENALNPQINNNDPLNISFGNPDLSPAYVQQVELSFATYGQRWSFTPRLSYSTSKGVIERYRTVFETGISETTYDNIGAYKTYVLILNGNYRPTKTISSNANVSFSQDDYTSSLNSSLSRTGSSLRARFGMSMELPFKTAFEGNVNYANITNAQGRSKGSMTTWMGARKVFMKNKLSARVSINDPFGKRTNFSTNQGTNFIAQNYWASNSSNVTLSLNYRFTRVNKIPPPPKP
ncbi:outer membrane beta-barrel protein [Pedobacter metabolipauper]|uniref:Outer membrane receptor protein involved in Fe transport n=1 Tax=Pedobacter metabolipauper TaxID=425513 RepID=A0A4R6SXS2_9SPHI|nr:outer membrane beta-barrel protein [Pedobacter metabolipauper]TDQ09275.1 outer membrane receptor protein involved in Fe transport [Pedobacter metabolipauper]